MPAVKERPRQNVDIRVDDAGAKAGAVPAIRPNPPAARKTVKRSPASPKSSRAMPIIITLFLIAAIGSLLALDVAQLRTRRVPELLRRVPFIGQMIPAEAPGEADALAVMSAEEAVGYARKLETENESLKELLDTLSKKTDIYVDDNAELKKRVAELEGKEEALNARQKLFDEMIAMGDASAYAAFYESVDPTGAEALYPRAALDSDKARESRNYVASFSGMDASSAARILERLVTTDMELVGFILKNMDKTARGEVLAAMDPSSAAAAAKYIAPAAAG